MAQYADRLTDGEKALMTKYPQSYWMNVYPSHRDFADLDETCARVKENAVSAEVIDDGKGLKGTAGAIPFPFPTRDRKSVVSGKSVSVRVTLGGSRIIKKKKQLKKQHI